MCLSHLPRYTTVNTSDNVTEELPYLIDNIANATGNFCNDSGTLRLTCRYEGQEPRSHGLQLKPCRPVARDAAPTRPLG